MHEITPAIESNNNPNAVGPVTSGGRGTAKGDMQVMDATAAKPGYGIAPENPDVPGDKSRVGHDLLDAMVTKYKDPAIAWAAYNAGTGPVDKWLKNIGDPRTGEISRDAWAQAIPFKETRAYVAKGLGELNKQAGTPDAPIQGVTGNMLKTQMLGPIMDRARQQAEQAYPGDVGFSDAVVMRVQQQGRQVIADQFAQQRAANDVLVGALTGSKPDGSDKAQDIDMLLGRPGAREAWDIATPETKLALQSRLAKGDSKWDATSFKTYYTLLGQAGTDPASFVDVDLNKYLGQIPDDKLVGLAGMQKSINTNDAKQQAKQASYLHADSLAESMLKPMGLGRTAKAASVKAADTASFYGQLHEAVDAFQAANGKRPADADVSKIAAGLLATGKQGGMFWDSATPAFKSPDLGNFYVPLPGDKAQVSSLTNTFQKVMGRAPADGELQQFYTKYKLSGGK
jgi:hypothetical protein